jgi:hypothetical protein
MMAARSGMLRTISAALLVLAVTACGSGGGSSQPASAGSQTSGAVAAGSSAAVGQGGSGASAAPGLTAAAPSGGSSVCPAGLDSGHAKYTLSGFEAWHFCGPATATITLGSATVTISGGSCTVPAAGMYSVSIGTQLFGAPPDSVSPDYLVILVTAADGKTDPGGIVDHKRWLLIGATIAFGAGKHSGTFSGVALRGPAVHGSFTCG